MLAASANIVHVSRVTEAEDYLEARAASVDVVLLDLAARDSGAGDVEASPADRSPPADHRPDRSGTKPTALEAVRKGARITRSKGRCSRGALAGDPPRRGTESVGGVSASRKAGVGTDLRQRAGPARHPG